jgi:glutamyl-tRNA synthetase
LLLRLGHSGAGDGYHDVAQMPTQFDVQALGHAPAQVDEHQLNHWQHEALARTSDVELVPWVVGHAPAGSEAATIAAIRKNVLLVADAEAWCHRLYGQLPPPDAAASALIASAGEAFWVALMAVSEPTYDNLIEAGKATGAKGKGLFQPLRLALTGTLEGPEMRPIVALLSASTLRSRFEAARQLAASSAQRNAT